MEFEFHFPTGGPADLEMSISGIPTLAGLELLNEQLVADPRFRAGLRILVEAAGIDARGISVNEVQVLSEPMVMRDWQYAPAAVAIVAPDEETSRALTLYRAHVGGSKSNRHVFASRQEAIAWLDKQESAPG
jgi:hypothetical protein